MSASIRAGDLLAGRYRLVDLLGETQGGWFWRGHDDVLHRTVAVHLLPADDDRAEDLLRAARISARLPDRRSLRVLDADLTDEVCFVVNEWGHGTSLAAKLEADGPIAPRRAAWLVAEVADTLATAHASGATHAHVVPENVLVDDNGEVRIIGFSVQAVLHGFPLDREHEDVVQLVGLLYAALTGRWPGPDASTVPAAPRELDRVLRPRQVRAGIPRALDQICDEVYLGGDHSRSLGLGAMLGQRAEHDLTTAAGVRDALLAFLGEIQTGGAPPQLEDDVLPVPVEAFHHLRADHHREPTPYDRTPPGPPVAERPSAEAEQPTQVSERSTEAVSERPTEAVSERPTEAGMPVFHDDETDVEWLRARSDPPPPPPEFEEPEARPLFAPERADGGRVRRTLQPVTPPANDDYWPWDTSGAAATFGTGHQIPVVREELPVPGRRWMTLAWVIGISALVLLGLVAAYQIGLGGGASSDPDDNANGNDTARTVQPAGRIDGIVATDLDPEGNPPEEYPENTPLAVDGDPDTGWATQTYQQQFGPGGLKDGVGLVLDLGERVPVRAVQAQVSGGETAAQIYVTDEAPTEVADLEPVSAGAGTDVLNFSVDPAVEGRYVVLWLTRIPDVGDGFRGQVDEVEVFS